MSISLENNLINYTNENGFEFINPIPYLNNLFSKHIIILITSHITTNEIIGYKFNERIVTCEDEILEWNLRAVDTFFPEILLAFSVVNCNSLLDAVEELSKKGYPYSKEEYSVNFLGYKLHHFFKAILFEDFFNGVYNGRISNKCYVTKENEILKYCQHYNSRTLIDKLLANSTVTAIQSSTENKVKYQLQFACSLGN